ncbi:MAG TPA: acetylglutamate kinase [Stellaceae bacterium]|nr:acetylglutamate kinase [Stellaceae bacterium]
MNDAEQDDLAFRAEVLSDALPFMRRYSGQTIVVKYGGHAMGDVESATRFARDIVLLKQIGLHPVVVHGGGPQIGRMLDRLNIKSSFSGGLRVTDRATVEIVEMVLCGSINKEIVGLISAAGGRAVGLSGKDAELIKARKLTRTTRDPGSLIEQVLDLGFVGEPTEVNAGIIQLLENSDMIPVVAPIGTGDEGETYNINADTAAGAIAVALKASRLLMLTDIAGVLDARGEVMAEISVEEAREMIRDGTIHGGMIPKIETCLSAVEGGVEAAVILDGRRHHAILVELLSREGAGTLIRRKSPGPSA